MYFVSTDHIIQLCTRALAVATPKCRAVALMSTDHLDEEKRYLQMKRK